jgi:predicted aldo/keto reductase-like oxidoreductase
MRLPVNPDTNEIDKEKAQTMVDYAIEHGINYFDTAYMYHDGQSEPFLGEALARHSRNSFNLASKMPVVFVKSEADVERLFEEQLRKCRVDYFDFYLAHNINEKHLHIMETCNVYETLKKKQNEGKIRHLGFSFHDRPEILTETINKYDWEFAQIQLNYMDWELQDAEQQYQILKNNNIPVVVMEPVRGGALARLCDESIKIFKEANPKTSPASWAIRYAASLSGVLTVLSGMSDLSQMQDNIVTIEHFKPLDKTEYAVIDKALAAYRKSAAISCTACRYCMDCPQGVDIPKVFAVYNNYFAGIANKRMFNDFVFDMEYSLLGNEKQASHCIACNQCSGQCPQKIDIPHWMETIDNVIKSVATKQ